MIHRGVLKCLVVGEMIDSLLHGRLSPEQASQVRSHVRRCPACREEFLRVSERVLVAERVPAAVAETADLIGQGELRGFRWAVLRQWNALPVERLASAARAVVPGLERAAAEAPPDPWGVPSIAAILARRLRDEPKVLLDDLLSGFERTYQWLRVLQGGRDRAAIGFGQLGSPLGIGPNVLAVPFLDAQGEPTAEASLAIDFDSDILAPPTITTAGHFSARLRSNDPRVENRRLAVILNLEGNAVRFDAPFRRDLGEGGGWLVEFDEQGLPSPGSDLVVPWESIQLVTIPPTDV